MRISDWSSDVCSSDLLTILGKVYDQPGAKQAEAVLRDLAVHPATARHVATKLARHFSGDEPPATLVDRLEKDFERTGGDLPSLYRTLVDRKSVVKGKSCKYG